MRIQRIVTVGITISALVAVLLIGAIPTPTNAGVYACPDMTGPGGLPDGRVDASDLSAFAAAKAALSMAADFNSDTVVDVVDQEVFESVFGQSNFNCEAFWSRLHSGTPMCIDMVPDGNIDSSDLSAFAAARGNSDMNGDFNGDGEVSDIDQAMLAMHLGETNYLCPGAAYAQYTDPVPPLPPVEQTAPEQPAQVPGESVVVLPVEETTSVPVPSANPVVVPPAPVNVVVPEVQRAEVTTQATLAPVIAASAAAAVDNTIAAKKKQIQLLTEPVACLHCSRTYAPTSRPIQIPENPAPAAFEDAPALAISALNDLSNVQIAGEEPTLPLAPVASAPIDSAKLPFFGLGIPGLILGGLSIRKKLKKE